MRTILSLLILALAAGVGAARPQRENDGCVSNMKQLALGILLFTQDHDEHYPKAASFQEVNRQIQPYIKDNRVAVCPAGKAYQYNLALSGVSLANIKAPAQTPLLRDSAAHADGMVTVAFADGHVKRFPAAEADKLGGRFK
jgi:prepilin-type processing-associated H-X9-DG protein